MSQSRKQQKHQHQLNKEELEMKEKGFDYQNDTVNGNQAKRLKRYLEGFQRLQEKKPKGDQNNG